MDKKAYRKLFEELAKAGELEPPPTVQLQDAGKAMKVVVRESFLSRLGLGAAWVGLTLVLGWAGVEHHAAIRQLHESLIWALPAGWLVATGYTYWHVFSCKTILIDRQYFRISDAPFSFLRSAKVPLLDVRVVDIEAVEKEHSRTEHGFKRHYSTYTFVVTISRTSDYRPVKIYTGPDERLATFLRHFLSRQIAKRRAAPDLTRPQEYLY